MDAHIFLFNQKVLVCKCLKKPESEIDGNEHSYQYWKSFYINKMTIDPMDLEESGEYNEFVLSDTETSNSLTVVADTFDIKNMWIKAIQNEMKNLEATVTGMIQPSDSLDIF